MLTECEKKTVNFIETNNLFKQDDRILLAVSGGADSTALLNTIYTLKEEKILNCQLFCAHINHQLRGKQADIDEQFVINQASKLSVPITTKRVNVRSFAKTNKLSIETAARQLRIQNLLEIAAGNKCNRIATGHQKNDNAETVLHRLIRGTGFRGLAGIWPARLFEDNILFVRPLLFVSRNEIIKYLQKKGLEWRQDRTNQDCSFRRNYIRHKLLPALQQQSSNSVVEQLFALSQSALGLYQLICRNVDELWPRLTRCDAKNVVLDINMFSTQPALVQIELIRRALMQTGSGERDLACKHYKMILHLAQQNGGSKKIDLPGGFTVWNQPDSLTFSKRHDRKALDAQDMTFKKIRIPGQTKFARYTVNSTVLERQIQPSQLKDNTNRFVEWLDYDKLRPPLEIRFRRPGDRFIPLGFSAEKKVGKFLTAQHVPQEIRRELLVVADAEKIIWLCPVRISEQAKVTYKTQKILQLQITGGR
ncbi:MAG: tRNA lysidine(34) synthetase TilS [Sedimentisphaerales bacterium]|nr:tRNA lysidine(34) synthetase TilS [Sedimentisphaerales bacterium]